MSISHIEIKSIEHLLARRHDVTLNATLPVGLPDSAAYYYLKESSFLSKKEEHWTFYFFQGLNTNPQNMSIFLRDQAQRQNKNLKQKLVKGVFVVYDLFSKADVVIEINIPGNLRIYKILNNKKELVSNQEIDMMYLSAVFRTMYQTNLQWGRHYLIFHDSKNYVEELRSFLNIAFRSLIKRDFGLGADFDSVGRVKGSHACSLIFSYLKERKLVRQGIELIEDIFAKKQQYRNIPKFGILLAEFYMQFGKPSKSIETIFTHLKQNPKQAYLLYYQAKYLYESGLYEQSLVVANYISQYNQLQIWLLLGQIHLEMKNFCMLLICLNHAVKLSKIKSHKLIDWSKPFEEMGKIKYNSSTNGIEYSPRLLISTESPSNIMIKQVEEKNKFMIERIFWRMNHNEKMIYNLVQDVRYRLESKRFQELLMRTFEDDIKKFPHVSIKKGLAETVVDSHTAKLVQSQDKQSKEDEDEDLPDFLKNSIDKVEESVNIKPSRNLSIIPEIESVIENSNYEERQKDKAGKNIKLKRQVNETLFKIVQLVLSEGQFQKAEYENNVAKILQVYNKMRTSSKFNTYYADAMFKIFIHTSNYKSIIVLIAETLDFLEQRGVRKMDKLPYWMHKYLFFIIEEKGLKFLNEMLEKLNFYDEAIVDTIEIAKNWKMKGVTY